MRLAGTANRGRCWGTLLLLQQASGRSVMAAGHARFDTGIPAPTWGCIISLSDSFSCVRCSNWKGCEDILDCSFQENICTFQLSLKKSHRTIVPWMVCAQEVLPFSWWVCHRALFRSLLAAWTLWSVLWSRFLRSQSQVFTSQRLVQSSLFRIVCCT
jgi:hypothetical protein